MAKSAQVPWGANSDFVHNKSFPHSPSNFPKVRSDCFKSQLHNHIPHSEFRIPHLKKSSLLRGFFYMFSILIVLVFPLAPVCDPPVITILSPFASFSLSFAIFFAV